MYVRTNNVRTLSGWRGTMAQHGSLCCAHAVSHVQIMYDLYVHVRLAWMDQQAQAKQIGAATNSRFNIPQDSTLS